MKNTVRRPSVIALNEDRVDKWIRIFRKLIKDRDLFGNFSNDIISKFAELSKYDNEIL